MRYRYILLLASLASLFVLSASTCPADNVAANGDVVIPMKVIRGTDYGPYLQIFTVPVQCGDDKVDFTWGCYGVTQISESFAKKCNVKIAPADELGDSFAGKGNIAINFGGVDYNVEANIIKDDQCQASEKIGVIGLDIAKNRQWTLDPENQTLTLRDLGADPVTPPLATLDLGDEGAGISIKVKIRNDVEDVGLMPSSSYLQAAPDLQRKWDLGGDEGKDKEAPKVFGNVRLVTLDSALELTPTIKEKDIELALVGDMRNPDATPFAQSGLGQTLLNRYVYTVDEKTRKFYVLKRLQPFKAKEATSRPSDKPAAPDQNTLDGFLKANKGQ